MSGLTEIQADRAGPLAAAARRIQWEAGNRATIGRLFIVMAVAANGSVLPTFFSVVASLPGGPAASRF
ncbi:hypothetical protein, partial [Mesorhizobium sp. M1C.F.Ca.ET.204.01.1.1]|uniref:hypothetical protein n=1 Tax=Mesorhizobium sp. M1C.F.Ca.ET.204.01.1.1 TaxID=2563929 RepID=UPI001AEF3288